MPPVQEETKVPCSGSKVQKGANLCIENANSRKGLCLSVVAITVLNNATGLCSFMFLQE